MRRAISLIGVYDADGTVVGEIRYWLGARVGVTHCSLCGVTHGLFTERAAWRDWRASLTVPFELFHRDDMPGDVAAATSSLPVVVARTDAGIVTLLGPSELDRCDGSLEQFVSALRSAVDRTGLELDV